MRETATPTRRAIALGGAFLFGFAAAAGCGTTDAGGEKSAVAPRAAHVDESLIWPEFSALKSPAPSQFSRFGDFVDVDGDLAIVGAPTAGKADGSPSAAARPGQAFVFARHHNTAPTPDTWLPEATLVAADETDWSEFGSAVALDGNFAVIGADGDSGVDANSLSWFVGAAYIFQRTAPGTWVQVQKLKPPSGSTPGPDSVGTPDRIWLGQRVVSPGKIGGVAFGRSAGISGDRLVACSAKADLVTNLTDTNCIQNNVGCSHVNDTGVAFVYERQPSGKWLMKALLAANDRAANDQFGINCRISGDHVIVGAFQADRLASEGGFVDNAGAAYIFERQADGTWPQVQKLLDPDGVTRDNFGVTVSIDGDTAVVGAKGADAKGTDSGAGYVFKRKVTAGDGGAKVSWVETAKLVPSDGVAGDSFGVNLAISSDRIIGGASAVGSPEVNDAGAPLVTQLGAVYFFGRNPDDTWFQEKKAFAVPPTSHGGFGLQVNLDGDTAIVASPFVETDTGRAFVFEGVDPLAIAAPCTEDQRCGSGHCEDGVCCDTACGECQACVKSKTGQSDGTCAPVPAGQDPDAECLVPSCAAGVQKGSRCSGSGACNNLDVDCITYACAPAGDLCNATCNADADCAKDSFCDKTKHECLGHRANGAACIGDNQCASLNCVDGLCCNSACSGQCQACDTSAHPGVCTTIAGTPHGKRAACVDNKDACAGTCDGNNGASCTYPDNTTTCAPSTCTGNSEQPSVCDSLGGCVEGALISCGQFACGEGGCQKSCAADGDCATGFFCKDAACVPSEGRCSPEGTRVLDSTGKFVKDCSPYNCVNGICGSSCAKTADCQVGFVCDRNAKTCKPVALPPPSLPVGCACRVQSRRNTGRAPAFFGLALALAATIRRRRRDGE